MRLLTILAVLVMFGTVKCRYDISTYNEPSCTSAPLKKDVGDEYVRTSGSLLGEEYNSVAMTCNQNVGEIHICESIMDTKCSNVYKCQINECCYISDNLYYRFAECSNSNSHVWYFPLTLLCWLLLLISTS